MFDKYDVLFIIDKIKDLYDDRKLLKSKYLKFKYDWTIRSFYKLRIKRSIEYCKKNRISHENKVIENVGIIKFKRGGID